MERTFSSKNRKQLLKDLTTEKFDLLIIGGGITGAGIALDAATRGMKVALVEMQDFASGTSSRSTKLIHGGLRYLKQFEFAIVRETGRERAIVYENGPHVTTPERMLLPFYQGGTFGPFLTSIGIWTYDLLAGVKKSERRVMLTPEQTIFKEPLLKSDGLLGGGDYVEYKTDDARLTIEVMKRAVERGAKAINYVKAETLLYNENKKVIGAKVSDQLTGETIDIKALKVVNAAGPWVDEIRDLDFSKNKKQLRLTKGIHLVFDKSVFPLKQAVYFDAPDGRMIFAIPRDGKTYVGTTDTFFDRDKTNPRMTAQDRDYLLQAIHYIFPQVQVTENDVESSWAGIRPLIYEEGKDASEISRKDETWIGESGLITIAGGKLTGYRKMAEDVVNIVSEQLQKETGRSFEPCQTKQLRISGGDFISPKSLAHFTKKKSSEAEQFGLTEDDGRKLASRYGTNVDVLFKYANEWNPKLHSGITPFVYAQLKYGIEQEMVMKPTDFFIRRTGALFFDIDWVREWQKSVCEVMAEEFGWTEKQRDFYEKELEDAIQTATTPDDEK